MDIDTIVNGIVRDLVLHKLITKDKHGNVRDEEAKIFINVAVTAGWEYYRKYEINHQSSSRKINYFSKDGTLIGTYPSIEEAARKLKIGRGTVDDILYGKTKGRRNTGNYFRYAEERKNTGHNGEGESRGSEVLDGDGGTGEASE